MSKEFQIIGGKAYDAMLYSSTVVKGGVSVSDQEGQFEIVSGVAYPILRETALPFGIRASGTDMNFLFGYSAASKSNPKIGIIGSSHSVSYGLSGDETMQYKVQAYADANWGGATITNLGLAGQITDNLLPLADGGTSGRNIDDILATNPDFIFVVAPTNDPPVNTPAQTLAHLVTIRNYSLAHGVPCFICSPLPRGSFGTDDQQELADSNVLWKAAFPYVIFDVFDSVFRDKTAATAAAPNMTYYQGDQTHLNDAGTTIFAAVICAVVERELRANTAYKSYSIEQSTNGSTGWNVFDTITDQQQIRKTFDKEPGYYRMRAQIKDGSYLPYSNTIQVTNAAPIVNAGDDLSEDAGTTSVDVTGSASDADGTIVSYLWEIVSGDGITLTNETTGTVTVSGMEDGGEYVLRLTATDNNGATGSDTVLIQIGGSPAKKLHVMFSKMAVTPPAGVINLSGEPFSEVPSYTDPVTGFGVRSAGTGMWNGLASSNAQNGWGATVDDGNGVFLSWPIAVVGSYWYEFNTFFSSSKYQIELFGLDPAKTYRVDVIGSRSNANSATGPYSTAYNLLDNVGNEAKEITVTYQNTHSGVTFTGKVPNSSGILKLALNRGTTGNVGHINSLKITEL